MSDAVIVRHLFMDMIDNGDTLFLSIYSYEICSGSTVDFMLSENRDIHAAKRFFKKALSSPINRRE
jgi:hypothetical protein